MEDGFVKLWRNINNNELLANDNNAWNVFTRLLTLVDWRTGTYKTGRKKLAAYMNMNDRTLYGVLKRLERATMLQMESNSHATTFHICNWKHWQQDHKQSATVSQTFDNTKQEVRKRSKNTYIKKSDEVEVLQILNEVTGRSFRVFPTSAAKTLESFKTNEIKEALTKMVRDDWHKPKVSTLSSDYMLSKKVIDRFYTSEDTTERFKKTYGEKQDRVSTEKLTLSRKQLAEMEYK